DVLERCGLPLSIEDLGDVREGNHQTAMIADWAKTGRDSGGVSPQRHKDTKKTDIKNPCGLSLCLCAFVVTPLIVTGLQSIHHEPPDSARFDPHRSARNRTGSGPNQNHDAARAVRLQHW